MCHLDREFLRRFFFGRFLYIFGTFLVLFFASLLSSRVFFLVILSSHRSFSFKVLVKELEHNKLLFFWYTLHKLVLILVIIRQKCTLS